MLLININASPYHRGKPARAAARAGFARGRNRLPILYVNCVGGQDELVFDGDSCALRRRWHAWRSAAPLFDEGVYLV